MGFTDFWSKPTKNHSETHLNWPLIFGTETVPQINLSTHLNWPLIFGRNRPKINETHLNWAVFLPKPTKNQRNSPQLTTIFTKPTKNQRNQPQLTSIFTKTDQKSTKPTKTDQYFYRNRPKINETHLNWPVFLPKPTINQRNPPQLTTIFTETDQKSTKPTSIDQYFYRNRPKIYETHLNWPVFFTETDQKSTKLTSIFTETDQKST